MRSMEQDKAKVLARWPKASVDCRPNGFITINDDDPGAIGYGPTEADAWRDAAWLVDELQRKEATPPGGTDA